MCNRNVLNILVFVEFTELGRSKSDAALKSNRLKHAEPMRYISSRSEEDTFEISQR